MAQGKTTQADILIIDDTPDNLDLLSRMLEQQGYSVRTATSGEIALQKIKLASPTLILLDIIMPGMDGYEVCARLKADAATRHIPIIFLSAVNDSEGKVRAFETGGVDYVTKPFHAEEVLARIRTHLALRNALEANPSFDALPDLICVFDDDLRVRRVNKALAHRLNRDPDDCIGHSCHEVFS